MRNTYLRNVSKAKKLYKEIKESILGKIRILNSQKTIYNIEDNSFETIEDLQAKFGNLRNKYSEQNYGVKQILNLLIKELEKFEESE